MTALFETARLLLREPVPSDAAAYFDIFGDAQANAGNLRGYCRDVGAAQAAVATYVANWEGHGFDIWAVCLKGAPARVVGFGGVGLRAFGDEQRLNLGYGLHRSLWGQGLAKELAAAGIRFACDTLPMPMLWARVQSGNAASRRILEGAGMVVVEGESTAEERVYSLRLRQHP